MLGACLMTRADATKAVRTYGEVGTLPDFSGSVDEIHQTDPVKLRNYLDGIPEESRGSDAEVELSMMGEVSRGGEKATLPGKEASYTAGLARTACHLAPQRWHAWGEAHAKAVEKAREAWWTIRPRSPSGSRRRPRRPLGVRDPSRASTSTAAACRRCATTPSSRASPASSPGARP